MKHKIKHYMAALLLTSMVWSGHAQEKNEMDLSGEVHWTYVTAIACRKASFCRELQMTIK